jgi:hypothetical protein
MAGGLVGSGVGRVDSRRSGRWLGALVGLMGLVMAVSACQLDGLPVAAVIDGPHGC